MNALRSRPAPFARVRRAARITDTWIAAGAVLVCAACGETPTPPVRTRVVTIAAAANLNAVWKTLADGFARVRPDVTLVPTFAATGTHVAQALHGAPFDVFLAADVDGPQKLVDAGLADPSGLRVYAIGRLALWARKDSPARIAEGLACLEAPDVRRIAIADPRLAPFGRAAQAALSGAGLKESIASKLVFGDNVAKAAQFASSGAADAALISLSQAQAPPLGDEGAFLELSLRAEDAPQQAGVVLKRAVDADASQAFFTFVLGPVGREIFARAGYAPPPLR